jgi:hypothetical protein
LDVPEDHGFEVRGHPFDLAAGSSAICDGGDVVQESLLGGVEDGLGFENVVRGDGHVSHGRVPLLVEGAECCGDGECAEW